MKKLSQNEIISRFQKIHKNKYDYSKTIYQNYSSKIIIICHLHGEFLQTARDHLSSKGCPKCGRRSFNNDTFIKKAKLIHGNKYQYNKVIYIRNNIPVEIICLIHGSFFQKPSQHLFGYGCKKCGIESKKYTSKNFISKANFIHNNKYIYDKISYINMKTPIEIICPEHGSFFQIPSVHLKGSGCRQCITEKQKLKLKNFSLKANYIHKNKYSYEKSIYFNAKTNLIIICPIHGDFVQTPNTHLYGKGGCPVCAKVISNPEKEWLDYLKIPYKYRHPVIIINNKIIKPDAYDPFNKTIYEFYGDFWHGNPEIYKQDLINPVIKQKFGNLYQETMKREQFIKQSGYNMITIWESDFLKCK